MTTKQDTSAARSDTDTQSLMDDLTDPLTMAVHPFAGMIDEVLRDRLRFGRCEGDDDTFRDIISGADDELLKKILLALPVDRYLKVAHEASSWDRPISLRANESGVYGGDVGRSGSLAASHCSSCGSAPAHAHDLVVILDAERSHQEFPRGICLDCLRGAIALAEGRAALHTSCVEQ